MLLLIRMRSVCIQLNTNVSRGLVKHAQLLWHVHNFCETCTTAGKRAQHLWHVHNISETCTYRILENTGWGRWNTLHPYLIKCVLYIHIMLYIYIFKYSYKYIIICMKYNQGLPSKAETFPQPGASCPGNAASGGKLWLVWPWYVNLGIEISMHFHFTKSTPELLGLQGPKHTLMKQPGKVSKSNLWNIRELCT